jgi:monothiol glutaredoxin
MPRSILEESVIHPAIRAKISGNHREIVQRVQSALDKHQIVVVGMGLNPFPRKACKMLEAVQQPYHYLEFGNYFNQWRERNALKLWTGWPTFPMIFVKGQLIGGATDLKKLIDNDELKKLLR